MDYDGSPEPIDFDFFDEGPSTKHNSGVNSPNQKSSRPLSGKRSGSARGYDGDYDRDSVRSVASSRSSVSVRIPTATPTHDDGNEADYYSDDFDGSDKDNKKEEKGRDTFRLKDDIDALKDKSNGMKGRVKSATSRPKTSVGRRKRSSQRRRNRSNSSSSNSSDSGSSSSFTSESKSSRSHSDNDSVTDVSPLQSPRPESPTPRLDYDQDEMDQEYEKMRSVRFEEDASDDPDRRSNRKNEEKSSKRRPKSAKFKDRPPPAKTPGYSNYEEDPCKRETEAKELSVLLRAVLELDEAPSEFSALHKNLKRPLSGKRKNRPQSAPMPHQRMNMSFSNDDVRRIDRDNKRLLEKIVGKSGPKKAGRPQSAKTSTNVQPTPVSHAAVRRQRDQRRIEMENLQILKRIEAARAHPETKKDALLRDYHQQRQYAAQVSKTPGGPPAQPRSRPASAKRTGKSYSGGGMNKASSMSSLGTEFSGDTFTSSSTARSRPQSAKWTGGYQSSSRPAWDDRFYLDH